jgi:hypothetical protein
MKYSKIVLTQRCTSRACAAVPCTGWNGPARHVAGEGRAASAIGGEGEQTLRERQMICLLWYGGGRRFDTVSSHNCTVHCTRAEILCTSVLTEILEELCEQYSGSLL